MFPNKMKLNESIKNQIREHALEESPKECCGVLVEKESRLELYKCPNYSERPTSHFYISAPHYLKASRRGNVSAIYHSHTSENENFSDNDKKNSVAHQTTFVLYNTVKNSFLCYDPTKNKTLEINKEFKIGECDCYTLVKDYYKKLKIDLEGINSFGNDWHLKKPELIQELFGLNKNNPSLPIEELPKNAPLKRHDVLVFELREGSGPSHVGVYLGEGILYHHPRNRYPTTEILRNQYFEKLYKIYRHKELNE